MIIQPRSQNISQKLNISEARNCSGNSKCAREDYLDEPIRECVRDVCEMKSRCVSRRTFVLFYFEWYSSKTLGLQCKYCERREIVCPRAWRLARYQTNFRQRYNNKTKERISRGIARDLFKSTWVRKGCNIFLYDDFQISIIPFSYPINFIH